MRPVFYISVIFILGSVMFAACKPEPINITGGGKGGASVIVATAEHANIFIDTFTVYIKYGTSDAPSNGVYDDSAISIVSTEGNSAAAFDGLTIGNYYLLAVGIHDNYVARGAKSCTIPKDGTINLTIPVLPY